MSGVLPYRCLHQWQNLSLLGLSILAFSFGTVTSHYHCVLKVSDSLSQTFCKTKSSRTITSFVRIPLKLAFSHSSKPQSLLERLSTLSATQYQYHTATFSQISHRSPLKNGLGLNTWENLLLTQHLSMPITVLDLILNSDLLFTRFWQESVTPKLCGNTSSFSGPTHRTALEDMITSTMWSVVHSVAPPSRPDSSEQIMRSSRTASHPNRYANKQHSNHLPHNLTRNSSPSMTHYLAGC